MKTLAAQFLALIEVHHPASMTVHNWLKAAGAVGEAYDSEDDETIRFAFSDGSRVYVDIGSGEAQLPC